jgi:hypothetical protein
MDVSESVLVLGAGELGRQVLLGLANHPASARARSISVLLRSESITSVDLNKQRQVRELDSLGIRLVPGDLASNSTSELADIFSRFDTVIGCTGFVAGKGTQLKVTRAALDAGVKRHVPWQFGVDYDVIGRGSAQDLFDEQLNVRDLLRSQHGTSWIIVSAGIFISFLFEPSFGVVNAERDTVRALGAWDNAVTVTAVEDIGKLTAEALLARPKFENQIIYIAGDTISYARLADTLTAIMGRPVRRELWHVAQLTNELKQAPDDLMRKYRLVFAQGKGVSWDAQATFNAQLRIPTQNLEQWIHSHLA